MYTRKDYLSGIITHRQYYNSVGKMSGVKAYNNKLLTRIKTALNNGDYNLNTISLRVWDWEADMWKDQIRLALLAHGDVWSLAGGVCVLKELYRGRVEMEMSSVADRKE